MNTLTIRGYYLDGQSAKRIEASLQSTLNEELTLVAYDQNILPLKINTASISITPQLGNTPREICLGEGRVFISDDSLSVNKLNESIRQKTKVFSFVHKLESNLPAVILFCFLVIASVGIMFMYGIPKASKIIAHKMPEQLTEQLASSLQILDSTVLSPTELSESRQQAIRVLFAPYLLSHKDLHPSIHFRSGMGANALALPNGAIVFTDDLVNLVKDDQQLIAVLFHELGHLKHKHITQRILQGAMITLAVVLLTGDLDSIDILTGLPTLLVDQAYSREFEREADNYSVQLLKQEGIPVESFAEIIQALSMQAHDHAGESASSHFNDYFSSHPNSQERIELINAKQE